MTPTGPTPYTPTDEEIRAWVDLGALRSGEKDGDLLWERWLAAHDARVRAEALRDAADDMTRLVEAVQSSEKPNGIDWQTGALAMRDRLRAAPIEQEVQG